MKTMILAIIGILSVQLLSAPSASAKDTDWTTLLCQDGARQVVARLGEGDPGRAFIEWQALPGTDSQLNGWWMSENRDSIKISGMGQPFKNPDNEVNIDIQLRFSPLRSFAQGTYSVRRGPNPLIESAHIECRVFNSQP